MVRCKSEDSLLLCPSRAMCLLFPNSPSELVSKSSEACASQRSLTAFPQLPTDGCSTACILEHRDTRPTQASSDTDFRDLGVPGFYMLSVNPHHHLTSVCSSSFLRPRMTEHSPDHWSPELSLDTQSALPAVAPPHCSPLSSLSDQTTREHPW